MKAEIISNGDELISGKILDTNAQWISRELIDLGVQTVYHTTVADELGPMVDVLRIASQRADLILWTGGLGPTADDLTRQAIADMIGVPLVQNDESLRQIEEMFKRRGREMPEANKLQAFQPTGAIPIPNKHGTAPGIDLTVNRIAPFQSNRLAFYRIMAMPGVPAEMKEMWHSEVLPRIQTMLDQTGEREHVIRFRSIHSFGLGESQIEAMLPGLILRDRMPRVGITANGGTITLRIAAEGKTENDCFEQMEPTAKIIYETLGNLIFGEGDDQLQDVVCRKLKNTGKKLAVIEAGTRGLLCDAFSSETPNSEVVAESTKTTESAKTMESTKTTGKFVGGIVLPPKEAITPSEMIRRGRRLFDADFFLLIGAYPPGMPDRTRNETTFIALVDAHKTDLDQNDLEKAIVKIENYAYVGHPSIIDDLFVKRGLNLLRLEIDKSIE
ncbi:MAG: CinA family nicotinamide mononucleotide deamidase-related protein [Thermoguttaceae bacterium]